MKNHNQYSKCCMTKAKKCSKLIKHYHNICVILQKMHLFAKKNCCCYLTYNVRLSIFVVFSTLHAQVASTADIWSVVRHDAAVVRRSAPQKFDWLADHTIVASASYSVASGWLVPIICSQHSIHEKRARRVYVTDWYMEWIAANTCAALTLIWSLRDICTKALRSAHTTRRKTWRKLVWKSLGKRRREVGGVGARGAVRGIASVRWALSGCEDLNEIIFSVQAEVIGLPRKMLGWPIGKEKLFERERQKRRSKARALHAFTKLNGAKISKVTSQIRKHDCQAHHSKFNMSCPLLLCNIMETQYLPKRWKLTINSQKLPSHTTWASMGHQEELKDTMRVPRQRGRRLQGRRWLRSKWF